MNPRIRTGARLCDTDTDSDREHIEVDMDNYTILQLIY